MHPRSLFRVLPTAALALFTAVLSSLSSARDWYEYKSDNFTVYSDVSKGRVEDRLQEMEMFRRAALIFTGMEDAPENRKLQIFHFNSSREFEDFSGDRDIAGFYRNTWDGPLIFSQRIRRGSMTGENILYHEYVHHLMRERSQVSYPLWYLEGFAELLASADIRKDAAMIGKVPKWRLSALDGSGDGGRLLKVEELIEPDYETESSLYWNSYYASAWMFTHYLQFGSLTGKYPSYREAYRNYLLAFSRGEDPRQAFETHFGKTAQEMYRELRRYQRQPRLPAFKFEIPPYKKEIQRRKLNDNERYFLLAEKALDMGEEELALEYLRKSEREQEGWLENQTLVAVLKNHGEDLQSAAAIMEKAEAANSDDYRILSNLSHYYHDRLQALVEEEGWSDEYYSRALQYGQTSISLKPGYLSAYRYVWLAQQQKGEKMAAVKTMMAAFRQDPTSLYINQAVGFYLARIHRADLARPFLERVVAWSHSGETRAAAKKILRTLDQHDASDVSEAEIQRGKQRTPRA